MNILLLTPPLTQLNTPYPATTVLSAYLRTLGHQVQQADLGILLINRIYQPDFLNAIGLSREAAVIAPVMRFLRGEDNTLAPRIANRTLMPEGPRFTQLTDMEWAFGTAGVEDRARYLATLFIEDIADYIRQQIDPHFDLIRYAEQLASFAPSFDPIEEELQSPPSPIDREMLALLDEQIRQFQPQAVGFAIPFPGCLYGALRCAQWLRASCPDIRIIFGGGFPNTEWRQLRDPRIFQYCHYITLDDGEVPLQRILAQLQGGTQPLVRTYTLVDGQVHYSGNEAENLAASQWPAPDFSHLDSPYLSLAEMANPMHRLWSQGRWNKMVMAHGCYWGRCAFCDTTLDYIRRYDAPSAAAVVDRMESIIAQTGITGFHFVDEALPPQLLRQVCQELLRRKLTVSFWGNIRFEKAYTAELANLMASAGCIAVSGGLEVASDRLLKLIDKGVTIDQTVTACRHFRDAGIMVHTYLMYGFPTETLPECIDALDTVRRMFQQGIVQSAFWHRYAMTCHSASGQHPEHYHARRIATDPNPFCNNEVDWAVDFPYDIDAVGQCLRVATYNYMLGLGLEQPAKKWFRGLAR